MSKKSFVTEIISKEDNNCVPILLDFHNGILKKEYVSESSFVVAKNKITNKNEGIFSTSDNIYHGEIKEKKDVLTNNFIAIKRGNKLRLIEIDHCTLIHDIHSEEPELINKFNNKDLAMKILMKNFGGKKSKAIYEKTERSKVNLDIIKNHLNKTVDEAIIQEDDVQVEQIDLIPPFNNNAKKISDLYNLTDILSQDFLNTIKEEAIAINNFETKELPISSEFIIKEISRVKAIKNENERHTFLKVLIYLDGILNYIKQKFRNADKVELSKISDKISIDICRRFSPKDSPKLVKTMISTNKAICYFIVLSLLIQPNLELDMKTLLVELSRPQAKVIKLCSMAHVKRKRLSDVVTFSLPTNAEKVQKKMFNRKTM